MKGLWQADTPRSQKWLIIVLMALLLGALAPLLFRSFVPSQDWQWKALWLSTVFTAAGGCWLWWLYRKNMWRPAGPWLTYSPIKRWLMAPLCIGFFVGLAWLNIACTVPMGYTAVFGKEVSQSSSAEKKRGSGRYACNFQLKVVDIQYIFFEFCIDEEAFDGLPTGPLPARLISSQTYFGAKVHTIELNLARHASP